MLTNTILNVNINLKVIFSNLCACIPIKGFYINICCISAIEKEVGQL